MKSKKIIDMDFSMNYGKMIEIIDIFCEKYDFISVNNIGKSIFGNRIPVIHFGYGNKKVLYVATHHGCEHITSAVLLRFLNELCELYICDGRVEGISARDLFQKVELNIIPMLNPDGVELAINGLAEDNVLYSRLKTMNGNSLDFSRWQANGRGVDLNHNYNYGFTEYKKLEYEQGIENGAPTRYSGEYPESEPEVGYLCNYIRFYGDFAGALTLHSQGEEIYFRCGDYSPKNAERIAKYISEQCGYRLAKPDGMAAYGGFTEWFINEFDRPSFTIECGKGSNPLPFSDMPMIYIRLRKVLFETPLIMCRLYP